MLHAQLPTAPSPCCPRPPTPPSTAQAAPEPTPECTATLHEGTDFFGARPPGAPLQNGGDLRRPCRAPAQHLTAPSASPHTQPLGFDLDSSQQGLVAEDADACCARCAAIEECRMWTWVGTEGGYSAQCWLKRAGSCGQLAPPGTAFMSGSKDAGLLMW